jgi:hypothetical protein
MTTDITTLQSAKGRVTFTVWTDNGGCDEDFEASIGGVVHLKLAGNGAHAGQSIAHSLNGPYNVVITAKTSGVSSDPTPLNLTS